MAQAVNIRWIQSWVLLFLLICLPFCSALAAEGLDHDPGQEPAAYELASRFLGQLDTGDYSGAWMGLDPLSRLLADPAIWQQRQAAIRNAYGALQQRQPRSVMHHTSYVNHPDGHYLLLSFSSRFVNKARAQETVVIRQQADNSFSLIAYVIN